MSQPSVSAKDHLLLKDPEGGGFPDLNRSHPTEAEIKNEEAGLKCRKMGFEVSGFLFGAGAAFKGYCAGRGNISKTARSIKFNVNAVNVINPSG